MKVFGERKPWAKDGIFKATNLENSVKKVVVDKLGEEHANERMFDTGEKRCKT